MSKIKITSKDPKISAEQLLHDEVRDSIWALTHVLAGAHPDGVAGLPPHMDRDTLWMLERSDNYSWGYRYLQCLHARFQGLGGKHEYKMYLPALGAGVIIDETEPDWNSKTRPSIQSPTFVAQGAGFSIAFSRKPKTSYFKFKL